MSEPFLAEIRIVGFNFAPKGWAFCDGQILPINQNQSLYSLLGTTYGGDGRTSFALPDLRGRTPAHVGTPSSGGSMNHTLGQRSGEESPSLSAAQIPNHTHTMQGSSDDANATDPAGILLARLQGGSAYHTTANLVQMDPQALPNAGGSGDHNNMLPFLTLRFCIALQGLFPSRS